MTSSLWEQQPTDFITSR